MKRTKNAAIGCFFKLLLLYALLVGANAQDLPPPPFWHFSVITADKSGVIIIFSKDWSPTGGKASYSPSQFLVEKSEDDLFLKPEALPKSFTDTGTAMLALDSPWSGSKRPYYRVSIFDNKQNIITASAPLQTLDQQGNTFVVNGSPSGKNNCGDLASSPCPDIRTALQVAPAGSTIYVTPGIYNGPGNTNLTFNGKPLTLSSTNGNSLTMINCTDPNTGKKTRAFTFTNGEGRDSIISGLAIAEGAADFGGCIYIVGATPTIRETFFFKCNATTGGARGGAIYASGNPDPGPLIENANFVFNWGIEGGAIFVGGSSQITVLGSYFEWGICPTATGRGGAVCAYFSNFTMKDSVINNHIVGFGGGAWNVERGTAIIDNVVANNNSAGNFGGAANLFGASMKVSNSQITNNRGSIFAGGIIVTSSTYEANDTVHENNWGRVGGGAIKVVGGALKLKRCKLNGNSASYGGGLDITLQKDFSSIYTEIVVEDTEIRDNVVPQTGAGYHLDAFDELHFRNVSFINNTATKGGAGYCNGPGKATYERVTFDKNVAQIGGGLYTEAPCTYSMDMTTFRQNTAVDYGAGLALGDGVVLNITNSNFEANGVSDCLTRKPPKVGGGMMIGVEKFQVDGQCGANTSVVPTKVMVYNTSFVGNVATLRGGGIDLEAGILTMDGVELDGNRVIGAENGADGLGGGIAVVERCPTGGSCSIAVARITNSAVSSNFAHSAGGGLHYAGGSASGGLVITRSSFTSNSVDYEVNKTNPEDGVGGGLFLGKTNFTLSELQLVGNRAFYGGGAFLATNLNTSTTKISKISASNNQAVLGPAAFWLRSASPNFTLPLNAFIIPGNQSLGAVATEVLNVSYSAPPPSVVRSAEDVSTFSVELLDYYGNVGVAELGACHVVPQNSTASIDTASLTEALSASDFGEGGIAPGPGDFQPALAPAPAPFDGSNQLDQQDNSTDLASNDTAVVRPLGSEVGVGRGVAVFSQLVVSGNIGHNYTLQVDCKPNSLGRSRFLELDGTSLPTLSLSITVAPCRPGREPKQTSSGVVCLECPYNTFNLDGEQCKPCPDGALCAGGDQVSSKQNWWRSSLLSISFYSCRVPNVCEAGPVAGNDACVEGHIGPLCAVCKKDWFSFANKCLECDRSGQAKAMLAFTVILIVIIIVLIFIRTWEFGDPTKPGIMTKVKIVITHFQILALFRDYDVLWPDATGQAYSWFDMFNIGLSMTAPSCFLGSAYSFWSKWIFQMLLPLCAVALCIAVYFTANRALKKHFPKDFKEYEEQQQEREKQANALLEVSAAEINANESGSGVEVIPNKDVRTPAITDSAATNRAMCSPTITINATTHNNESNASSFPLILPETEDQHDHDNNHANSADENDDVTTDEKSESMNKKKRKKINWAGWLLDLRIRCWKNAFWLVTLLYPRSSMTALQMFGTQTLDTGTYLTADYSIMVKPPGGSYTQTYINYMIPGAIMLAFFALAIPAFWFMAIWRNRHRLEDRIVAVKYGFLYGSYKRKLAYWETFEALRKFIYAFIPVFVKPNSVGSLQGTFGQLVSCIYLVVTIWCRPYANEEDNYLQIASLAVLWLVLLTGSTAKWLDLSYAGLRGFAAFQLFLSSAVVFACVALIVFTLHNGMKKRRAMKEAALAERLLAGENVDKEEEDTSLVGKAKKCVKIALDRIHRLIPKKAVSPDHDITNVHTTTTTAVDTTTTDKRNEPRSP